MVDAQECPTRRRKSQESNATESKTWGKALESGMQGPAEVQLLMAEALRGQEKYSQILFWRCQIQISARNPAILTEVFRNFLQTLQAIAGIIP
jgi:hypothetical protein